MLNNRGYTIERAILGRHSDYNDVVNWTYVDVPRVFGIDEDNYLSRVCETRSGLESALRDAADAKSLAFIEVQLEALDMPPATAAVGDFTRRFDYGEYGRPTNSVLFDGNVDAADAAVDRVCGLDLGPRDPEDEQHGVQIRMVERRVGDLRSAGLALNATPRPAAVNMSMSFAPSPTATVCSMGTPA